ncbi:MAG: enterochelin esterase-like enzyme [Gammaproteobacteria bacterium]|nr:enterochelin esterase-like enzyme [Gammaproteobacteria bacterium]
MNSIRVMLYALSLTIGSFSCSLVANAGDVRITLGPEAARGIAELGLDVPVVGRAFVILSRNDEEEPRLGTGVTGNPLWGVDVREFAAGDTVTITDGAASVSGYPLERLADVPPGDYRLQAFLNVYTTFRRADGHVVEAHLNSGAFQSPFEAPGNAYSAVRSIKVGEGGMPSLHLTLEQVIQPPRPLADGEVLQQGNFEDTDWVRYVKIRSDSLSRFWGRDMYIGANILLPPGYDDNPRARYPVLYMQGHSSGLTPMPWAPEEWFHADYEPTHPAVGPQLDGFYEAWTSGRLPKIIVITFRDANPYFDTSYSVNTENVGPYGDALTRELMPHLEQQFRIVSDPWGRVLAGRSTGGWEAAAMMVFYPDLFAGSFPWAPDPIDFRKLMQINIYDFGNAFLNQLEWISTPLPAQRETDGLVNYTVADEHAYEQTVATKDRSGGQWAIWQALYSPVGSDGYPVPLWDPHSGEIDRDVAVHWRDNWDLSFILQRDWATLGPKLSGKLHFAVGMRDNYYLEQSVYLTEERLAALDDPPANATFQYGIGGRHSWIGHSPVDPQRQMTYAEFIGVVAKYITENAPADADLESWRY